MTLVNLALQGGGSHGAFTWGAIDALLGDPSLAFSGISGTSAGAVNAVALASGWATAAREGASTRDGARQSLRAVWDEVVRLSTFGSIPRDLLRAFLGFAPLLGWRGGTPPLSFNPLQPLLTRHIDFDALQDAHAPRVFVGATHVRSGRAAIFSGADVTLHAVLASACLPQLFPPVTIRGEQYWDGGYSVNPPLAPFLHERGGDVLLVQINAVLQPTAPRTPLEVQERANELTFNAGLLSQIRAVEHVNQLVDLGLLPRQRKLRLHRIDGGEDLARFPTSTRSTADAGMVRELFALGQASAQAWLRTNRTALGERGTLPYADYADDTWLQFLDPAGTRGWKGAWRRALRSASRLWLVPLHQR